MIDPKTGEISLPYVRNPFIRKRVQFSTAGDSKTHQSHREAVDVNNIIARYERTGQLPPARMAPQYADVTGLQGDLTDLYNTSSQTIGTADQFFKNRAKEAELQEKTKESPKPIDAKND